MVLPVDFCSITHHDNLYKIDGLGEVLAADLRPDRAAGSAGERKGKGSPRIVHQFQKSGPAGYSVATARRLFTRQVVISVQQVVLFPGLLQVHSWPASSSRNEPCSHLPVPAEPPHRG